MPSYIDMVEKITGERAKELPNYPGYFVTEYGRVFTYWSEWQGNREAVQTADVRECQSWIQQRKETASGVHLVYGIGIVRRDRPGRKRRVNMTVGRAVAMAWLPNRPEGSHRIQYKDGDSTNTHYSNIEWQVNKAVRRANYLASMRPR